MSDHSRSLSRLGLLHGSDDALFSVVENNMLLDIMPGEIMYDNVYLSNCKSQG